MHTYIIEYDVFPLFIQFDDSIIPCIVRYFINYEHLSVLGERTVLGNTKTMFSSVYIV